MFAPIKKHNFNEQFIGKGYDNMLRLLASLSLLSRIFLVSCREIIFEADFSADEDGFRFVRDPFDVSACC